MSIEETKFSLAGFGYVESCCIEKQRGFLRIRMPISLMRQTEDICLDCAVDDSFLKHLEPIHEAWKNHHTVKIKFEAQYNGFNCCHVGRTDGDPDFMLMFLAQLQSVERWYCDDRLVIISTSSQAAA